MEAGDEFALVGSDPIHWINRAVFEKVANKCYRPATKLILDLIRRHEGRFRVAYSISGVALEQFEIWAPDVLDLFRELSLTGACEFLAETSHHSLSFLSSREEFSEQVAMHHQRIKELFGTEPTVFRNTELTYSNEVAAHVASLGRYKAILCEGVDDLLGYRSPNYVYVPPGTHGNPSNARVKLLLKNHRLSDDIAFRFSDRNWSDWPLTAETFAKWVNQINGDGYLCNLFMDYETLGEHQWADTGIFDFLDVLPEKIFDVNPGQNDFATPSECIDRYEPVGEYDVGHMTSWADTERDLSAWMGNAMQEAAAAEFYRLEEPVKARHAAGDDHILEDWRKLSTSDHLYYMCTKYWADGDVHKYFSPYDSPYDSYINFMNVLDNLRTRAGA